MLNHIFIIFITFLFFLIPVPHLCSHEYSTYMVYFASKNPSVEETEIVTHINLVAAGYYEEAIRGNIGLQLIEEETVFFNHVIDNGLNNTNAELVPMLWEHSRLAIYINKNDIRIFRIQDGIEIRVFVGKDMDSLDKAKQVLLSLADLLPQKRKNAFERKIRNHFAKFLKTINLGYNFFTAENGELVMFPANFIIGLSLPVKQKANFNLSFYGDFFGKDFYEISGGLGIGWQTTRYPRKEYSPSFGLSLDTGYTQLIRKQEAKKIYAGGIYLEPAVNLGFWFGSFFKAGIRGSLKGAYFPGMHLLNSSAKIGIVLNVAF
ncbi:MAG: hypothetical protein FWH41_00505 [Treponema sp.]|nr:hypothetical protein [Treponema sp.]